jgi:hypothetical protein
VEADGHRVIPLILTIFADRSPTLYTVANPGGPMKYPVFAILIVLALSLAVHSQQQQGKDLSWAFPVKNGDLPPEPAGAKSVPNSKKTYDQAQIEDLANPPDWFPEEHAAAPQIVQHGHGDALACGACHLMSGVGHPESADMRA